MMEWEVSQHLKSTAMLPVPEDHRLPGTHIVLLPSAGMGHLTPLLRLAVELSGRRCQVSLVTTQPTVSAAESRHISDFFASFPGVRQLELHFPPLDPSEFDSPDPFCLRFEEISRSAHLLPLLLAGTSPPVSAVVVDISTAFAYVPVVAGMGISSYVLFTASAAMLSLCAYFPTYIAAKTGGADAGDVDIPGLGRESKSSIPVWLSDPGHLFTKQFVANAQILAKAKGILINTLREMEPAAIAELNAGKVMLGMPPVLAIGPLPPLRTEKNPSSFSWLDEQPEQSVVYVSFGSRTAMSREQIRELGIGLERSGCRFLWVVKTKVVDKEEEEEEEEEGLKELLGEGYLERVKNMGLVVKNWVEQEQILRHRAVGGFVSHCGWNSVTEAALHGVRVLAWPRMGDQRLNAGVVARSGLGIWVEKWSWEGETEVVKGEEISERVRELMGDEGLRASAARLMEEAAAAVGVGGSSCEALTRFIGECMN